MEFKEIAYMSGKPGLYHVVKPTRNGVILESMDDQRKRMIAGVSHKVSLLKEISIYTTDAEDTVDLEQVLMEIYKNREELELPDSRSADNEELREFMSAIVPNHNEEKVYPSDIKKLLAWYRIIAEHNPEVLEEKPEKKEKKPKKKSKPDSESESAD